MRGILFGQAPPPKLCAAGLPRKSIPPGSVASSYKWRLPDRSRITLRLDQPDSHMSEVLFGLVAKLEKALDESGLGFLHVRLTSLDLGHHNGGVLQGPDGLVVAHAL
jgi:hypothetical protein